MLRQTLRGEGTFRLVPTLRTVALWTAAVVLGLLPFVVAADYGGLLAWTQAAAAAVITITALFAAAGSLGSRGMGNLRQYWLLVPLGLWVAYAWLQTFSLPSSWVALISPASQAAYTEWIAPFLSPAERPQAFPISLAPYDSRHAAAMLAVVFALVWTGIAVFRTRARITWLLTAIALGASAHAVIGLLAMLDLPLLPSVVDPEAEGSPFGTFVNRNNAALLLNFGLAASLGLLSWRLTALTGAEVDDEQFAVDDLISLVSDRESIIGVLGFVCCTGGLLVCGSRGGIAAALAGTMLALGWVRRRRGLASLPVIVAFLALAAAVLLIPMNLNFESLRRLELFAGKGSSTLLHNGRLQHWPDGFRAAWAHFPAGSGLSTYAYAYLPHQAPEEPVADAPPRPTRWFHHADNLWLELLTEQGLIGSLLAVSVLLLVIRSLSRLSHSPDPIDQGLRITGWFSLGAIVVSQTFDFGLIVPANLFLAAILFAALAARGSATALIVPEEAIPLAVDEDWDEDEKASSETGGGASSRIAKMRECWPLSPVAFEAAMAAVALLLAAGSVLVLRSDAFAESTVRRLEANWREYASDETKLAAVEEAWTARAGFAARPRVAQQLARVQYQLGRLEEVARSHPPTEAEAVERYRDTAMPLRSTAELSWTKPVAGGAPRPLEPGYQRAWEATEQVFCTLPLSLEARAQAIHLDFVHLDPVKTTAAIKQLHHFYRNNPKYLIALGTLAARREQADLAGQLWHESLKQRSEFTERVLRIATACPELSPVSLLPQRHAVYFAAAKYELTKTSPNLGVLRTASQIIDCSLEKENTTEASCQILLGDIAWELEEYRSAFEHYDAAVGLTPNNTQLRAKFVRRLIDRKQLDQALAEARAARETIPAVAAEMNRLIEEIAHLSTSTAESDPVTRTGKHRPKKRLP